MHNCVSRYQWSWRCYQYYWECVLWSLYYRQFPKQMRKCEQLIRSRGAWYLSRCWYIGWLGVPRPFILMLILVNYPSLYDIAWKVSVFGVFLVRNFLHSDWIRRGTVYLSVFSLNARKYGPEKLRIRALFTKCDVWRLYSSYLIFCSTKHTYLLWLRWRSKSDMRL